MADPQLAAHHQLVERLTAGFESLFDTVENLVLKNSQLEAQVRAFEARGQAFATRSPAGDTSSSPVADEPDERLPFPKVKLLDHFKKTSDVADGWHGPLASYTESCDSKQDGTKWWQHNQSIEQGVEAWRILKNKGQASPGKSSERLHKIEKIRISQECSANKSRRRSSIPTEQDFTTRGVQGDLKCPFTSTAATRKFRASIDLSSPKTHQRPELLPTPPDFKGQLVKDPLAVEFHTTEFQSPPPSVTASASKCPIRFLDQHSPEEVAKYFENHKHEIPRSHEVCVKRYQTNEESIRQLDAKYGNLVNMIQGLGMKHQPMLTTKEEDEIIASDPRSVERVEKWAEICSVQPDMEGMQDHEKGVDDASDVRSNHFDRPLQEVRLGESPSRPWGIQVPYTEVLALSTNTNEGNDMQPSHFTPSGLEDERPRSEAVAASPARPTKCPMGHGATQAKPKTNAVREFQFQVGEDTDTPQAEEVVYNPHDAAISQMQPKMIFTGPVFFGYTAEQASTILQNWVKTPTP